MIYIYICIYIYTYLHTYSYIHTHTPAPPAPLALLPARPHTHHLAAGIHVALVLQEDRAGAAVAVEGGPVQGRVLVLHTGGEAAVRVRATRGMRARCVRPDLGHGGDEGKEEEEGEEKSKPKP